MGGMDQEWAQALDDLLERIGPRFTRSKSREHVKTYIKGMWSPVERKNSWPLAAIIG